MAIGDWMKSDAWLANIGHVLGGAVVTLVAVLFTRERLPLEWVEGSFVGYVLVKEYVIDLKYESDETVGSSTIDAVGYMVGNALAWGLVAWAHALGRW
jgi:hypothetical protein